MRMIDIFGAIYVFAPIAIILIIIVAKRCQFKNRSDGGAFFFEDNYLVLNTGIPCAMTFHEIECVELHYSSWELEHKWSYNLYIKVIKKNGEKKRAFYKGYRTAKFALPSDMEAALKEKGIRCIMFDE